MNLDEKSYVEQQVANRSKSLVISYVLWFFLGALGGHRFYYGKTCSAIVLLLITLFTSWWSFGIFMFIWLIIDALLIPSWKRRNEQSIREQAISEVKIMSNN
ncbi:TM2 domain-containing protein [Mammaliicoccus vitulinus]|uniref:TM2 domain-containing protein n=1 Tax=Mammaliicoccus vitulinus TaxID=71237 RepID=A0ABX7HHT7_9STAP|nr:TM2 domain-containing protein [Mammaliicoccus vitulinus]PNZ40096.1 TM2 domain-containing protein [Mammaliicoccus vitulinus]QRO86068.1 TM2 domain-containing protein [Mammaliicoccus vitulinus]